MTFSHHHHYFIPQYSYRCHLCHIHMHANEKWNFFSPSRFLAFNLAMLQLVSSFTSPHLFDDKQRNLRFCLSPFLSFPFPSRCGKFLSFTANEREKFFFFWKSMKQQNCQMAIAISLSVRGRVLVYGKLFFIFSCFFFVARFNCFSLWWFLYEMWNWQYWFENSHEKTLMKKREIIFDDNRSVIALLMSFWRRTLFSCGILYFMIDYHCRVLYFFLFEVKLLKPKVIFYVEIFANPIFLIPTRDDQCLFLVLRFLFKKFTFETLQFKLLVHFVFPLIYFCYFTFDCYFSS